MSLDNKMEAIHCSGTLARLGSPESGYLGVREQRAINNKGSHKGSCRPSLVCVHEPWWTAVLALPVFLLTLKKKFKM